MVGKGSISDVAFASYQVLPIPAKVFTPSCVATANSTGIRTMCT